MAGLVAALMPSHAPLITGKPEVSKPEQRDRLYGGFHELRRRLAAARPDLIVMFVNDHIQNFSYSNMPAFCVGLAEAYDAPSPGGSRLMRIAPRKVRGAPAWGMALLERGLAAGVDFAYSYEIEGWDELSVPLHFLTPEGNVPIAPVYTNCAAPPLPTPRRCHEVGAFVGEFIRSRPTRERVALLATGGTSHWMGTPQTGPINAELDQRVKDHGLREDIDALTLPTHDENDSDRGNDRP